MSTHTWTTLAVSPVIVVSDLDAGAAFYARLGFELKWKWPEAEPSHAGMKLGGAWLMLARQRDPAQAIQRAELYFFVTDVAACHAHARAALGGIVGDVADTTYGMRDFSLMDPWGHVLTFGQGPGEE